MASGLPHAACSAFMTMVFRLCSLCFTLHLISLGCVMLSAKALQIGSEGSISCLEEPVNLLELHCKCLASYKHHTVSTIVSEVASHEATKACTGSGAEN